MREAGAEIIAEDLGIVPEFVHASLARLAVPGYRVFRWERLWHEPGQPFRDPATYPPLSVATTGTHDTEPLALWWEHAPPEERAQVAALRTAGGVLAGIDAAGARAEGAAAADAGRAEWPAVRDALLEALFASGSDLLLFPIQDVFGWRDRINVPATVNERNWSYRLPWPTDQLEDVPEARERRARLREWTTRYRR